MSDDTTPDQDDYQVDLTKTSSARVLIASLSGLPVYWKLLGIHDVNPSTLLDGDMTPPLVKGKPPLSNAMGKLLEEKYRTMEISDYPPAPDGDRPFILHWGTGHGLSDHRSAPKPLPLITEPKPPLTLEMAKLLKDYKKSLNSNDTTSTDENPAPDQPTTPDTDTTS